jgi:hypothetical protein
MNTSMAHQTDNKETMEAALPVIRFCFMMMMIMMMIDDDDEGFREAEMATPQSRLMAGFGRNCCRGHPSWVLGAGDDAMNGNAARARQAPFPWILSMQARKTPLAAQGQPLEKGWLARGPGLGVGHLCTSTFMGELNRAVRQPGYLGSQVFLTFLQVI